MISWLKLMRDVQLVGDHGDFHKHLIQDGNGKLDYGEFVKMILEY